MVRDPSQRCGDFAGVGCALPFKSAEGSPSCAYRPYERRGTGGGIDAEHRDAVRTDKSMSKLAGRMDRNRHLQTGSERLLAGLPANFAARDFDVAPTGSEIILGRAKASSDLALIERPSGYRGQSPPVADR